MNVCRPRSRKRLDGGPRSRGPGVKLILFELYNIGNVHLSVRQYSTKKISATNGTIMVGFSSKLHELILTDRKVREL